MMQREGRLAMDGLKIGGNMASLQTAAQIMKAPEGSKTEETQESAGQKAAEQVKAAAPAAPQASASLPGIGEKVNMQA
jgi:hypothetical protein